MPVQNVDLQLDQGASFAGSLVWVAGGVGVNPAGTTAVAIFRQVPVDTPLLTLTQTQTALGVITYLPSISNYTFFDPESQANIVTTVYPIEISIFVAGMALLIYPSMRWKITLTWPDGTALIEAGGDVEVDSI